MHRHSINRGSHVIIEGKAINSATAIASAARNRKIPRNMVVSEHRQHTPRRYPAHGGAAGERRARHRGKAGRPPDRRDRKPARQPGEPGSRRFEHPACQPGLVADEPHEDLILGSELLQAWRAGEHELVECGPGDSWIGGRLRHVGQQVGVREFGAGIGRDRIADIDDAVAHPFDHFLERQKRSREHLARVGAAGFLPRSLRRSGPLRH